MKSKITLLSLTTLFSVSAFAETVQIKLGTLAPIGSPWFVELKKAAQQSENAAKEWTTQHPDQPVDLKITIYGGGTMGDESSQLTKMRIGTLQAAGMSTIGMHQITTEPQALDIPMLVENEKEKAFLIEKMTPELDAALEKKGYVVVAWSEVGFTRFFSTTPRPTLGAMRQAKLFAWEGDDASIAGWKAGGFNPVGRSATEMISSLKTGMLDTIVYPPALVLALRGYENAKYMMDLKWSSLTAATIVKKDVWEKIPGGLRPLILQLFREGAKKISQKAMEMEEEAIKKMQSLGLTVVPITDRAAWDAMVKDIYKVIPDKIVPGGTFQRVMQTVSEYRSKNKK